MGEREYVYILTFRYIWKDLRANSSYNKHSSTFLDEGYMTNILKHKLTKYASNRLVPLLESIYGKHQPSRLQHNKMDFVRIQPVKLGTGSNVYA